MRDPWAQGSVRAGEAQTREVNDRRAGGRDRDKILERRRLFVASALAGTVAVHCNPFQPCLSPAVVDSGISVDSGTSSVDASDASRAADALIDLDAGQTEAGLADAEAGPADAGSPKDAAATKAGHSRKKASARPCLIAYVPEDDPFR
jgi:hypothetical protein